jgi:predicted nucleic acid-binding Zn ribbon protein
MSIQDRDYYKEKIGKIEKQRNRQNFIIWLIVVIVILGLILSSLRF